MVSSTVEDVTVIDFTVLKPFLADINLSHLEIYGMHIANLALKQMYVFQIDIYPDTYKIPTFTYYVLCAMNQVLSRSTYHFLVFG